MANVVVVGSQWGDEGKGKIVDWLSEQADIVVRFQGGHNAGHTLVIDGTTYKLSLLPSGVVRPGKLSVIGNGVVLDPRALIEEIDRLAGQGVKVTPRQSADRRERHPDPAAASGTRRHPRIRPTTRIGTTRRGIGPAYEDKVGRRAIRLMDLADPQALDRKIDRLLAHHNALRRGLALEEISVQAIRDELAEHCAAGAAVHGFGVVAARAEAARGQAHPVRRRAGCAARRRPRHLPVRDVVEHRGSPGRDRFRSRSRSIGYVLGICKAYTTRVGEGPFPTEQKNEIGRILGERGREFGVVTGRPRRCGWFDAVLVRQTARTSGINGLALTKLDILDGFDEIKVCTGYRLDGREIDYLPGGEHAQARVEPIYETIAGWQEQTARARSWGELPAQAIKYVRRVEELVGCPVALLSTSPEREDTILMQNPFEA